MQDNNELEVTTPAEDVYKEDELDRFLAHTSTSNKSFVVRDRTGLRLSFSGLLPITTGDNGEQRIWGGSIILNSAELEFPKVDFKLRASAKKSIKPDLSCNRSKGSIKQKDIFVLSYQLSESFIEAVQLTLIIDGSPYEVPLCKTRKADYYWIGKETNVPDGEKFVKNRRPCPAPKPDPAPKAVSPGRLEHLPEELKTFLTGEHGLDSLFKLLHPHAVALFRDLSGMKADKIEAIGLLDSGNATDVIAQEIVRRFRDSNRQNSASPPMKQLTNSN